MKSDVANQEEIEKSANTESEVDGPMVRQFLTDTCYHEK